MRVLSVLFGRDADVVDDRAFRLLLLVNLAPPLGTSLLSPLLSSLTGTYGVTEATIGLVMTVYTAASIVFIPVAGTLSDRIGRKPILLAGLLLFGLGGGGLALTDDFTAVLALRFLQGIGFSALTPVIVTSVGDLFSTGEEATAQGLRFAGSGLSLMVFPPLAGVLVAVAWNLPFVLYLIPFPVAVLVFLFLEEPARSTNRTDTAGTQLRSLVGQLTQPRITATLVGRAVPNYLYITFLTYNSFLVVRALQGSPGEAGLLVTVASVGQAVTATQVGRITALFETRFWPLVGATVLMSGGLAAVGIAGSYTGLLVGSLGIGVGFAVSLTLYRSRITGFSTALRGGLVSLGASFGRVAATAAPIMAGAAIAVSRQSVGFVTAVRRTIVAVAVGCLLVGLGSLLLARLSPAVTRESGDDADAGTT
jgi:MFS family permease